MSRLNIICLGVKDIVAARAFYQNLFGFVTPQTEPNPPVVFFNNNGSKLELYPLEGLAKDINEATPPPHLGGFPGITLAYVAKTKEEADDIFARAVKLGGKIAKAPQRVFWGGYSGYLQDIDGYYWEVAFFEGWKFDDKDMLVIE